MAEVGLNHRQLFRLQRVPHDLRFCRVKQDGASSVRGQTATCVRLEGVTGSARTVETTWRVGAVVTADRGRHRTLINV